MSGVDHLPRPLGELAVSDRVRAALAALRHGAGVTGRAALDADRVHAIEVGIAFRFPDDVLAIWAADVPALRDRYELTLSKVVAHAGALRDCGARGDLIGLGRVDSRVHLCMEKSRHRADAPELSFYDQTSRSLRSVALPDWLDDVVARQPAIAGTEPPFRPELTRPLPGGSHGTRVRHPKFGDGRVYVEHGNGPTRKVKVEFPKHGLKVLQARFLEYLDD